MSDYEELDKMNVPNGDAQTAPVAPKEETILEDEVKVTVTKPPKPKKLLTAEGRRQKAQREKSIAVLVVVAAAFVVLLIILIAVGVQMNKRVEKNNAANGVTTTTATSAAYTTQARAAGKTYFLNEDNIAQMSSEGVKSVVQEAYYTEDGSLAVRLSLSNGMDTAQRVVRATVRVVNAQKETIAEQSFDSFETETVVSSGSYATLYLVIDKSYVTLQDDSLSQIGSTIQMETAKV